MPRAVPSVLLRRVLHDAFARPPPLPTDRDAPRSKVMEDDAPSDPHALLQSPYILSSLLPPSATAHAPTGIKTRSGLVLSAAQAHARKDHRALVDAPAEPCRGRSTMSDGDRMHPLLGADEGDSERGGRGCGDLRVRREEGFTMETADENASEQCVGADRGAQKCGIRIRARWDTSHPTNGVVLGGARMEGTHGGLDDERHSDSGPQHSCHRFHLAELKASVE